MKHAEDLPYRVNQIRHLWIEMRDGIRLSARAWLPDCSTASPVPAIVEYIPYRKDDFTAERDSIMHPYFAGHGYACVRVDVRGSGDSEGVLKDEYLPQEQDDGLEVLRWIAQQDWCDGNVGMIGISWGGFNSLQIAARQPSELKAVIAVCATDDRYADDIHHMSGCLLGDNLSWASVMFAYNSLPPDPLVVGAKWRDMWLQRLAESGLWLKTWLSHQRRDSYWRQGSVCEDYAAIQCPVYTISGWADGYSNAVFRLLANLRVPRKGLIGPWAHKYPHLGMPGPAIGFLQECLRWWDKWLKGRENDVMAGPMLRVWMQDSVPPTTSYSTRPGRWVGEDCWPSDHVYLRPFYLSRRALEESSCPHNVILTIRSPLTVGLFAGKWCSYAAGPDLAHDQREEDGGALVFDSEPLGESLEILGPPMLDLELSSDKPIAMIAARLSDVQPDDKATRVTYGLLNLTHRDSNQHPTHLEADKPYRVRVQLNAVAQSFPAGHRLRLSLSTSYWPLAWVPPEPVRLTIHASRSWLELPIRTYRRGDHMPDLGDPVGAKPISIRVLEPAHDNWLVTRDLASDVSTLEVIKDRGLVRLEDTGLEILNRTVERYSSRADDFSSVCGVVRSERGLRRQDWSVHTVTQTTMSSTPSAFHVQADLDAFEGNKRSYAQSWDCKIDRDFI